VHPFSRRFTGIEFIDNLTKKKAAAKGGIIDPGNLFRVANDFKRALTKEATCSASYSSPMQKRPSLAEKAKADTVKAKTDTAVNATKKALAVAREEDASADAAEGAATATATAAAAASAGNSTTPSLDEDKAASKETKETAHLGGTSAAVEKMASAASEKAKVGVAAQGITTNDKEVAKAAKVKAGEAVKVKAAAAKKAEDAVLAAEVAATVQATDGYTIKITLTKAQRVAALRISGTATGSGTNAAKIGFFPFVVKDLVGNTNAFQDEIAVMETADTTISAITKGGDSSGMTMSLLHGALLDVGTLPLVVSNTLEFAVKELDDNIKPTMVQVSLTYSDNVLLLTGSETLDATPTSLVVLTKLLFVNETGSAVGAIPLDGNLPTYPNWRDAALNVHATATAEVPLMDGVSVAITITEPQRVAAIAHSSTPGGDGHAMVMDVITQATVDLAGNIMDQQMDVTIIEIADTLRPVVKSANLNFSNGVLRITASETLDATPASQINLTRIVLQNFGGNEALDIRLDWTLPNHERWVDDRLDFHAAGAATVMTIDGVTVEITLSEPQRSAAVQISATKGGDATMAKFVVDANAKRDIGTNFMVVGGGEGMVLTEEPDVVVILVLESVVITYNDPGAMILVTASETIDATLASLVNLMRFRLYRHGTSPSPTAAESTPLEGPLPTLGKCLNAVTHDDLQMSGFTNLLPSAATRCERVRTSHGSKPATSDAAPLGEGRAWADSKHEKHPDAYIVALNPLHKQIRSAVLVVDFTIHAVRNTELGSTDDNEKASPVDANDSDANHIGATAANGTTARAANKLTRGFAMASEFLTIIPFQFCVLVFVAICAGKYFACPHNKNCIGDNSPRRCYRKIGSARRLVTMTAATLCPRLVILLAVYCTFLCGHVRADLAKCQGNCSHSGGNPEWIEYCNDGCSNILTVTNTYAACYDYCSQFDDQLCFDCDACKQGCPFGLAVCIPGWYCTPSTRTLCPGNGYYCPDSSKEPLPCPVNTYVTASGQSSCIHCTAGMWTANKTAQTSCNPRQTPMINSYAVSDVSYIGTQNFLIDLALRVSFPRPAGGCATYVCVRAHIRRLQPTLCSLSTLSVNLLMHAYTRVSVVHVLEKTAPPPPTHTPPSPLHRRFYVYP
jgi:hypothetical protein